MATELGKAYVQIVPSAKGIKGMIEKELGGEVQTSGRSLGSSLGSTMMTGLTAVVASGAVAVGAALAAGISEGAALQQSMGGIETLFKGSADTVMKNAQDAYKTAGISANDYMEQATSFSATLLQGLGGDTEKAAQYADKAIVDMSDNANKMGTDIGTIQQAYQGFARDNFTMLDSLKLGYGGTQEEMARLVNESGVMGDGFTATAENVKDIPFDQLIEAIHATQEEMGITGTTAEEASQTVSGSFASMVSSAKNAIGGLALGEDIKPQLEALVSTTSTFLFDNLFPMVGNILSGLPSAIVTIIQSAIPEIQQAGSDLMASLGLGMSTGLPDLTTTIQPIFDGLKTAFGQLPGFFSSIMEGFAPVLETIMTAFSQMDFSGIQSLIEATLPALQAGFETFMSVAGPAISTFVDSFVNLWNVLQPVLSIISEALMPVLQILGAFLGGVLKGALMAITGLFDILSATLQFLTPVIDFLVQALSFISPVLTTAAEWIGVAIGLFGNLGVAGQGLKVFISSAFKNIGNVISTAGNIAQTIINAMKGNFNSLKNVGDLLKNGLVSAWNSIKNGVVNTGNVITDKINSIKNIFNALKKIKLSDAGKAIMQSFLDGLKAVWQSIQNFVGGIGNWIKENKGPISYDKKLLIPAGQAIMGGFNDSLMSSFGQVKSNISGVAGQIRDSVNGVNGINLRTPSADFATGSYFDSGISENITNVQTVLNVDGKEIARTTEKHRQEIGGNTQRLRDRGLAY